MKIYTCRYCGKKFEAKEEEKGITWFERSKGWNYHMECWKYLSDIKNDKTDEQWIDMIFDLIKREIKGEYNYHQIISQVNALKKKGRTSKGIYFSLYYFFIIKENVWKQEYGIGIVDTIYELSSQYWINQENKNKGLLDEIVKLQQTKKTIIKPRKRNKNIWNLEIPE
jgi:hypothetical protein